MAAASQLAHGNLYSVQTAIAMAFCASTEISTAILKATTFHQLPDSRALKGGGP